MSGEEKEHSFTIGGGGSTWTGATARPMFRQEAPGEWSPNIERLFATMERRGLDGLVVHLRPNVFYLGGYASRGTEQRHETEGAAAVVISRHQPDHPILVVEAVDVAQPLINRPTWIKDIRSYLTHLIPPEVPPDEEAFDRFAPRAVRDTEWGARARENITDGFQAACKKAMADLRMKGRIGFDNLMFAPSIASPDMTVVNAYSTMRFIRQVKMPEEIRRLRNAASLNATAIQSTINNWSPGLTWAEMNHIYDLTAVALGGWIQNEGGIVLSNAEEPDTDPVFNAKYTVEDFVITPGTSLMLDCHGTLDYYRWDGGKTWVVDGERSDVAGLIQKASMEASQVVMDMLKPGMGVNELQMAGREVFRKMKVPDSDRALVFFHGMGLDHTDIEVVGDGGRPNWKLEENMVIATHVAFAGDPTTRFYLEDVGLVRPGGGESLYTWGLEPHHNQ